MSASNPGPVRRFFRGAWRVVDVSRRVVLNLLFLLILIAVIIALAKSGPPPLADKTALVLRIDGTIGEQKTGNLRSTALDQVRGEAVAEGAAARHPRRARRRRRGSEDLEPRPRPRRDAADRLLDAARDRRRDRPLQGERQEGRRLGLGLRPAPVLRRRARRRGLPAPARHGLHRRLRQPAQLLQGRARQARRHRQRRSASAPSRARSSRSSPTSRRRRRSRPTRCSTAASGRPTSTRSRRSASSPPARSMRGIDEAPQRLAAAGGDAAKFALAEKLVDALKTRDELRALMIARGAKDDDENTFRQISFDDYLGHVRPRAHRRRDRRRRRRGRDRRRPGAGRNDRRPVDRQPDQEGARQQGREGGRPARRFARRQRRSARSWCGASSS